LMGSLAQRESGACQSPLILPLAFEAALSAIPITRKLPA
jgi:hypothetical protein